MFDPVGASEHVSLAPSVFCQLLHRLVVANFNELTSLVQRLKRGS
jgi:hypothetical protein